MKRGARFVMYPLIFIKHTGLLRIRNGTLPAPVRRFALDLSRIMPIGGFVKIDHLNLALNASHETGNACRISVSMIVA